MQIYTKVIHIKSHFIHIIDTFTIKFKLKTYYIELLKILKLKTKSLFPGRKRPWWSILHPGRLTWHPDKLCFFAARCHPHWPSIQSLSFQSSRFLWKVNDGNTLCIEGKRMRGMRGCDGVRNDGILEAIYRKNLCL